MLGWFGAVLRLAPLVTGMFPVALGFLTLVLIHPRVPTEAGLVVEPESGEVSLLDLASKAWMLCARSAIICISRICPIVVSAKSTSRALKDHGSVGRE